MKKVLVLGAGLVTKPLVRYLLDQPDYHVTVASRTVSKAERLIDNHPRGEAHTLLVTDRDLLNRFISNADLAISLVPYAYHVTVAELCLANKKHMVTTSYVQDAMQALDGRAKEAGVILLNEIGLDPGIDHMSAMKIIHGVEEQGGKIASFYSYCGGLPAPDAVTTPFGYKFSWSPRGVVLAGKNTGRYRKDGKEVFVPGPELFSHYWTIDIEGLATFEAYPNRNSLPYIEKYGLTGIQSMYRGTLRNSGWCDAWKKMVEIGYLGEEEGDLQGLTFADLTRRLAGIGEEGDLKEQLAARLSIEEDSEVIRRLDWLGLLGDDALPVEKGSPLDVLAARLLEKLQYAEGERDMIVLHHDFIAEYPGPRRERITSTLIDYGIPGGDSAMSRTVSLPAAIAARLILDGKISMTGVHIPVTPEIYNPVLEELETMDIICQERTMPL
jgi:saccharopine dehydrogenase (NADP+, L-glutamate forming)/spermidine synthase